MRRIHEPRNGKLPEPDYHRFLSKAVCMLDTMCWEWTGVIGRDGYGRIGVANFGSTGRSQMMGAHRYSYQMYNGFLREGMVIMHLCDNPKCVNPAHLQMGTHSENSKDMFSKKRDSQRLARRKLTDAQVAEIRARHIPRKITHAMLAKEYGVSTTVIAKAVLGMTYQTSISQSVR